MAMDGRGGEGQRWAFECVVRASVTRTEVPSSAVVGVVDAGRTVTVTRLVDAPKCGVRFTDISCRTARSKRSRKTKSAACPANRALESVTLLSPAGIRRQQGWTAPNPG